MLLAGIVWFVVLAHIRFAHGCFKVVTAIKLNRLDAECRAASSQPQIGKSGRTAKQQADSTKNEFQVELACPICLRTQFHIDASVGPTYK